jgi:hypothetical protein
VSELRDVAAAEAGERHGELPAPSPPSWKRRGAWLIWPAVALAFAALVSLGSAAFAPVESLSRERVFEIPKGTWARRMSGNQVEILPDEIRLTLGVKDVLVLKNLDDVPQIFGPTLMMPGQSFRLPFAMASSYQFACTAHASGQMTITVDAFPASPWSRLRWRFLEWKERPDAKQESKDTNTLRNL